MLLKHSCLEAIRDGRVSLVFRRWKRPTVKAGGRLRTAVGELAIEAVDIVSFARVTEKEARAAGFAKKRELEDALRGRDGELYRVRVRYDGVDRRVALRQNSKLTRSELDDIAGRLGRMDARSKDGAWTTRYLGILRDSPEVRAADLAESIGLAKAPFKQRVRRLKELGLTESLEVGYRLSPRGCKVLAHLEKLT